MAKITVRTESVDCCMTAYISFVRDTETTFSWVFSSYEVRTTESLKGWSALLSTSPPNGSSHSFSAPFFRRAISES